MTVIPAAAVMPAAVDTPAAVNIPAAVDVPAAFVSAAAPVPARPSGSVTDIELDDAKREKEQFVDRGLGVKQPKKGTPTWMELTYEVRAWKGLNYLDL